MSQVDYLHFFNNIIWNFLQLLIMYVLISVVYVQNFYKIFRLRLLNYNCLSNIFKNQDFVINKSLNKLKKFYNFIINNLKFYKINKNNNKEVVKKCFYE